MGKILKNSKNKRKILYKLFKDKDEIGDRMIFLSDMNLKHKKDKILVSKINTHIRSAMSYMNQLYKRIEKD